MATCKQCGQKYSIWSARAVGSGLCNKCYTVQLTIEEERGVKEAEEARARAEDDARKALPDLATRFLPGHSFTHLGLAYWDTLGTSAVSGLSKWAGAAVFGGIGMAMAERKHRVGLVALTDTDLWMVDIGDIDGENVALKAIRFKSGPSEARRIPLSGLKATCQDFAWVSSNVLTKSAATLSVTGSISVKAMFSDVFYEGNKAKAQEIAAAITAAARTACELQPERDRRTEAAHAQTRAAEQEDLLFGEFLAEYDPTNEVRKYLTEGQLREEFGRWRRARDGK